MKTPDPILLASMPAHWLQLAAAAQFGIALLNLAIPRILAWQDDLGRLPLLIREVFQVHLWFISITVAIFAILTWRFSGDMAAGTDEACRWLAAAIGFFWATRTVLQLGYYSSSHWRGKAALTGIHVALLVVYGGLASIYLTAALRAPGGVV